MSDENPAPKGLPNEGTKKMALTERERQLVMEHRAKTAGDRAFNDGLDHAIECIPTIFSDFGPDKTSWGPAEVEAHLAAIKVDIGRAARNV